MSRIFIAVSEFFQGIRLSVLKFFFSKIVGALADDFTITVRELGDVYVTVPTDASRALAMSYTFYLLYGPSRKLGVQWLNTKED